MKKTISFITALALALTLAAQTMNVQVGNVVYQFPAAKAGEMTYADGAMLSVMGKTFTLSEITRIFVDASEVTDNTVSVSFSDSSATVTVAGNVAQYVIPSIEGAHVGIAQSNTSDVDGDEITYALEGNTSDGEFYLSGSYKCSIELRGLTMTNTTPVFSGAALHVQNGKRIDISVKSGTENTLTDSPDGAQKACLYVKGHAEFKGKGTLNVIGTLNHGIKTGEQMTMRNCTVNVLSAAGDGVNCSRFFLMESGSLTLSGVGDDALQCDIDDTDAGSTGQTENHEDEDSGNIYIEGGTLGATASGSAAKCLKSEGTVMVGGGSLTLDAKGDIDLADTSDPSYTCAVKAAAFVQNGGNVEINVTGAAGRGISAEDTLTIDDGSLTITNTGQTKSSSTNYFCAARGMKANTIVLNGGTITVSTSGAASKGIKADKGNLTITGGTVTVTTTGAGAYDGTDKDAKGCAALDADGNIGISGGTITLKSTGTGGKGIKCDGTLSVSDGTVNATSTGSNYKYSSSLTASAKAIKAGTVTQSGSGRNITYTYSGGIVISGGTVTASASSHEAIESKSTIDISGGYVYASSSDDAINSASDFTISGGYVMGNSSGNDGLDANGDFYVKGGTVFTVAARSPEVGIDANTEQGHTLYVTGGNIVAIGGLESGSSLSQTCWQTSSYTKGAWYALYEGNTLVLTFKVPSNSSMGASMVVSTAGNTALTSVSNYSGGTQIWNGYGLLGATISKESSTVLSEYKAEGSGGGGGGGGGHGGGGGWGSW